MIWIEFGMLLRLVGVMSLILILSCPLNSQRIEPYLCDCLKKNPTIMLAIIQAFTDLFLSNFVLW